MGKNFQMEVKGFFRKFKEWEYWPTYLFYWPNIPYALYLVFRARHLAFYTATNPGIKSSGHGAESKFDTLKLIPDEFKPKTILVPVERNFDEVLINLKKSGIEFPLIVKPDVGFRGLLVTKISNEEKLKQYLDFIQIPLIIQEFISFKNECGIFYHRLPNSAKGKITSLTLKQFLTVKGDGVSSIKELIVKDFRANHYAEYLANTNRERLDFVPVKDDLLQISDIGNHCKGTTFINGNYLINDQFTQTMDAINHQIEGWFYGRMDVKYNNLEELIAGKNLKIMEINGIISEPTHIFDPSKMTFIRSLGEIRKHWKIVYEISILNHQKGVPYKSIFEFVKEIIELKKYIKKVEKYQMEYSQKSV